ncbi:YegS/Rv2252/BmrU family lipid kinase [bacterium 1XD42-8]|nr:YegS/Rv2252/BmrU family lipid kinase [Lachnospiraceae bacterium]RKJ42606.1 YegS/Rv2252/BmrU family lipid kinase [bacterium 1XD42-8]
MENNMMLFIYNPYAGKAQIKGYLSDIIDMFVKAGYEVIAHPTQENGDGIRAARDRKKECKVIVCSGGDGTLDEVVTGMMQQGVKVPIGYIPAGSTNDFGNSLKIPKNMIKAAELIVNGNKKSFDIGSFNDDTFVYIAAFGIFTDVSYETKQSAKNVLGHIAYLLEGVKRLSSLKSFFMKITCEGEVIEDEFIFGMVTNSLSVGGFKSITGKNVTLDDGLFEVTMIKKPKNPIELNSIVAALMIEEMDTKYMYTFKAKELTIESQMQVAWTLDGEYGGEHSKVEIRNINKAIEIFTPE